MGLCSSFCHNKYKPFRLLFLDLIEVDHRLFRGDWGEGLCEEDKRANAEALRSGARLLSAYVLPDATRLWIITDAVVDEETGRRQATTLLLPEEY